MTLLEIEAFFAVVKYGTISAAAENLYVSQPALTRRIKILESELGYPLFRRSQGHRLTQLTDKGIEFQDLARKWQRLIYETEILKGNEREQRFRIGAIDSLNHNILVPVFQRMIRDGYHLLLYHAYSEDVFSQMEKRIYDLVFFTQQDYTRAQPKDVIVRPLYSEAFGIATMADLPNDNRVIQRDVLNEKDEIFLPWNKEFCSWHSEHFDEMIKPLLDLQHAILAQYYLTGESWTFAPYSTCLRYARSGCNIYTLPEMPPYLLIDCAYIESRRQKDIDHLLEILKSELQKLPEDIIHFHSI